MSLQRVPTVILTGPVGVGKTSIAFALSERLNALDLSHALIDMDSLRQCFPSPPDDPFHMQLGLRNLAAVWANCRAVGADRLILVDVVEDRAVLADYQQALPEAAIQIVRLTASLPTLHRRLEQRESGTSLDWHQNRAAELTALMDARRVEDILIETEGKSIVAITEEVLTCLAWIE